MSGVPVVARCISKTFTTRDGELRAVEDVSFEIGPGEFVSLIGPSGCGKSTILSMLAGLIPADRGELSVDGVPVREPFDELGVVFQRDLLLEWKTILDNVLLPVRIKRLRREAFVERALELLELVGLREFARRYPHQLSGGMRQRVSLCRCLILAPRLLLMDEPFAALDALTREQLGVDLLRIHERYRPTVVFITHSIEEAVFLSDRVILLSPRPARVAGEYRVDLPRDRDGSTRRSPDFLALVARVREGMERRGLPHVP